MNKLAMALVAAIGLAPVAASGMPLPEVCCSESEAESCPPDFCDLVCGAATTPENRTATTAVRSVPAERTLVPAADLPLTLLAVRIATSTPLRTNLSPGLRPPLRN